jgi:hypothetical protein
MIVNCWRLRNILSFHPYLSVKCIRASLPKIVDRINYERGEAPRARLPNIIYTTSASRQKSAPGRRRLQRTGPRSETHSGRTTRIQKSNDLLLQFLHGLF